MESIIFNQKSLDSTFIIDPIQNDEFSFGQVFSTVKELNIEGLSHSRKQKCLIISSSPYFIISFILKCWEHINTPAVISPNLKEEDYKLLFEDISFDVIVTDDLELSKSLGITFTNFKKNITKSIQDSIEFNYELQNTAIILFSSGTTGKQKIIPLSFYNIVSNINSFKNFFFIDSKTSFLCTSPVWFAHGLYNSILFAFFLQKKVIYSGVLNLFNASKVLQYCINKPEIIYHLTPSMIPILCSVAKRLNTNSLPKFKHTICGTSYLDSKSKLYFESTFNLKLIQQYGMTEALFISFNDKPLVKPKSVGIPLDNIEIKIFDNNSLSANQHGKIFIKSPSFCGGYLNDSESILIDKEGFFFTGDIGYLDNEGYLHITGREKDIIKKGGLAISPSKLNNFLMEYKNIKEAYTIGKLDPYSGEEIYCFIVTEKSVDINKVKEFLKTKLNINLLPKKIFSLKQLPRNEMGKVVKKELFKIINTGECLI